MSSDVEIVARVMVRAFHQINGGTMREPNETHKAVAAAVVAALEGAGRLLPEGLALPQGEKVVGFCVDRGELQPFWPEHLNDEA